jgi:cytochrome c peroxidase
MFLTPTLRNVALRRVFFHNGVFHSLTQVLDF